MPAQDQNDLISRIESWPDFPIEEAHKLNRNRWSDINSPNAQKFSHREPEEDIINFFDNFGSVIQAPLLDLGCAGGHNLEVAYKRGIFPLYGVDISSAFVSDALARVPSAEVRAGDMKNLPYEDNYFRTIVARGVFHLTTANGLLVVLGEANRVMTSSGILYVMVRHLPDEDEKPRVRKFDEGNKFTYLVYENPLSENPNQNPIMVRNYVQNQENLREILLYSGFKILEMGNAKQNPERNRKGIYTVCEKIF